MGNDEFLNLCKDIVVDYFNSQADSTDKNGKITTDNVFVVWSVKALQNNKALLSTTVSDGMYYEITHNGDKKEISKKSKLFSIWNIYNKEKSNRISI